MYPGATGCNTIPNSEDVAPAAGRVARQPSNPKSDYETKPIRPFFSIKAQDGSQIPSALACGSTPDATQMQPHATLSSKIAATQPSRRGLPQITVRNGFSPSSPAVPIRLARNGADTMKLNDLRENWPRSSEERRAALPNRPGPRQPTVASIAERHPFSSPCVACTVTRFARSGVAQPKHRPACQLL